MASQTRWHSRTMVELTAFTGEGSALAGPCAVRDRRGRKTSQVNRPGRFCLRRRTGCLSRHQSNREDRWLAIKASASPRAADSSKGGNQPGKSPEPPSLSSPPSSLAPSSSTLHPFAPAQEFELRRETLDASLKYVRRFYPDLADLVMDGTLVCLVDAERSDDVDNDDGDDDDGGDDVSVDISRRKEGRGNGSRASDGDVSCRDGQEDGLPAVAAAGGCPGGGEGGGKRVVGAVAVDVLAERGKEGALLETASRKEDFPGANAQTVAGIRGGTGEREGDAGSGRDEEAAGVGRSEQATLTRLQGAEPPHVFLIGTAHGSAESAHAVARVIGAVRPDNVVVELCRGRAPMMYAADQLAETEGRRPLALSQLMIGGDSFTEAMMRTVRRGGQGALLLRLLLSSLSDQVSKGTTLQPGEEFRVARKVAEEVGAQIVLGDRPVEVTLRRAWEALAWPDRARLLWVLLAGSAMAAQGKVDLSEDALRRLRSDDALSTVFQEMGQRFPSLLPPLVYERDAFIAWSVIRSKAVRGSKSVVAVMGRGHLRGVTYLVKQRPPSLRFKQVAGQDADRAGGGSGSSLGVRLLVETVLGILAWQLFEVLRQMQGW